jgi:hypothetical protein
MGVSLMNHGIACPACVSCEAAHAPVWSAACILPESALLASVPTLAKSRFKTIDVLKESELLLPGEVRWTQLSCEHLNAFASSPISVSHEVKPSSDIAKLTLYDKCPEVTSLFLRWMAHPLARQELQNKGEGLAVFWINWQNSLARRSVGISPSSSMSTRHFRISAPLLVRVCLRLPVIPCTAVVFRAGKVRRIELKGRQDDSFWRESKPLPLDCWDRPHRAEFAR